MKITILGAGGSIGKRILNEAARRNHEISLITSKPVSYFELAGAEKVTIHSADIFDTETLSNLFKGNDVVISAYAPPADNHDILLEASRSLVNACKNADVRLIAVGGAGSLRVNENTQLIDTPDFPEAYRSIAAAHRKTLESVYYHETALNWTNVSPSAYIFEGERTDQFRIGEDNLLLNENGESAISMEDFAIGILNEAEEARFIKKRFTIGY